MLGLRPLRTSLHTTSKNQILLLCAGYLLPLSEIPHFKTILLLSQDNAISAGWILFPRWKHPDLSINIIRLQSWGLLHATQRKGEKLWPSPFDCLKKEGKQCQWIFYLCLIFGQNSLTFLFRSSLGSSENRYTLRKGNFASYIQKRKRDGAWAVDSDLPTGLWCISRIDVCLTDILLLPWVIQLWNSLSSSYFDIRYIRCAVRFQFEWQIIDAYSCIIALADSPVPQWMPKAFWNDVKACWTSDSMRYVTSFSLTLRHCSLQVYKRHRIIQIQILNVFRRPKCPSGFLLRLRPLVAPQRTRTSQPKNTNIRD